MSRPSNDVRVDAMSSSCTIRSSSLAVGNELARLGKRGVTHSVSGVHEADSDVGIAPHIEYARSAVQDLLAKYPLGGTEFPTAATVGAAARCGAVAGCCCILPA